MRQATTTAFAVDASPSTAPPRREPLLAMAAMVAAVLVMFGSSETTSPDAQVVGVSLLVAAGIPLLWRRRWPVGVLLLVTAITFVYLTFDHPGGAELPLLMLGLYTAMAEGHRRAAVSVLAGFVAVGAGYRLLVEGDSPVFVVITAALLVLVVLLGDGAHTRRQLRSEVRERLRIMETEKELEGSARVTEERVRIARELHDVLAHTITTITVQAGAVADGLPEGTEARLALASMRRTAQEAMQQLGSTIEVLRSEDEERRRPVAPGLAELDHLVRGVEAAGLRVSLTVDGGLDDLPATIELTAFRVIQEALTNVIRHADTEMVRVRLRRGPDALSLSVEDDGAVASSFDAGPVSPTSAGHGIVGMRERVQAVGGRCDVGPREGGGFEVRAVLPLGGSSS